METLITQVSNEKLMKLLLNAYKEFPPLVAAFDTESTGLHIINDKPFVFQFGWYNQEHDTIYVGVIDLEECPQGINWIEMWHEVVKDAPLYVAHNTKFDLHMLYNIGVPYSYTSNLSDTQFYIRFAHDNVAPDKGGVLLGLKEYATRYVDPQAKHHDTLIRKERSAIAKKYNSELKNTLGWTMKRINEFFKDKTVTSMDFPSANDYSKYMLWKNRLPDGISRNMLPHEWKVEARHVPYNLVDRETLLGYAAQDIVLTIKVWLQTEPVVKARETTTGLELENEFIIPAFEMERQGYSIDRNYITTSFYRMKAYIRHQRQALKDAAGFELTANQNKVLLEFLNENGVDVGDTGADTLKRIHKDYPNNTVQEVVDLVVELRTLEKWFSTYLMRFMGHDKIYTQINQVGAVTLRMSSDFQQFPRGAIKDKYGNEIFYPRRAIKVDPEYDSIVMLDYSQIELRVQALYTILVEHPDLNLCRAYMPYQCYCKSVDGVEIPFNHKNPEDIKHAYDVEWFQIEDNQPWIPTDVHGATAQQAFDVTPDHPEFSKYRDVGKTVNFSKNYGAQRGNTARMFPEYSDEMIDKIDGAYYKAFPGIKYYQDYCYQLANYQPYATNLFSIRYWNVSGHNLINMLIQGSSATLLKKKIIELHRFLTPYKSKMLMPIHDEIQFNFYDDELHLIPELKRIMEDWEVYVPIVADIEITKTCWSEKEAMD